MVEDARLWPVKSFDGRGSSGLVKSRNAIALELDALERDLADWHTRARTPMHFWPQLCALAMALLAQAGPDDAVYVRERLARMLA